MGLLGALCSAALGGRESGSCGKLKERVSAFGTKGNHVRYLVSSPLFSMVHLCMRGPTIGYGVHYISVSIENHAGPNTSRIVVSISSRYLCREARKSGSREC